MSKKIRGPTFLPPTSPEDISELLLNVIAALLYEVKDKSMVIPVSQIKRVEEILCKENKAVAIQCEDIWKKDSWEEVLTLSLEKAPLGPEVN